MRLLAIASLFMLAACGSGDDIVVSADLSVMSADDLGLSDLGASADLALGFCDRLNAARSDGGVASDRAVAYMMSLLSCFHPSGSCQSNEINNFMDVTFCWDDGTSADSHYALGSSRVEYGKDGHLCGAFQGVPGFAVGQFCVATPSHSCEPDVDAGEVGYQVNAKYDGRTFTCPDGTTVDIGYGFGGCGAELNMLLDPAETCDGKGSPVSCNPPP
jgi:hypothetical protein